MFFYYLQKWWNANGWTVIFISLFIIIFFLWFFAAGKNEASSETNISNALEMMVGTNFKKNYENTQLVLQNNVESPNHNAIKKEKEFIYDNGGSKGENECRRVLEKITGKKFHKVRPDFLQNPVTGNFLELDMYNDELKIAVEYNGGQHEKYNKFMHQGSMDKFRNQQYRDYIKQQLCSENDVFLIIVPHTIKIEKIENFLIEKLQPYINSKLNKD